jgi:hypothetical protein
VERAQAGRELRGVEKLGQAGRCATIGAGLALPAAEGVVRCAGGGGGEQHCGCEPRTTSF